MDRTCAGNVLQRDHYLGFGLMALKNNNTLGQSAAGIADDAWYEGSSSSSSSTHAGKAIRSLNKRQCMN